MSNLSTSGVVITRFAGALYNLVLDHPSYTELVAGANNLDNALALVNQVFQRDFASRTNQQVADTIVANLGLTGEQATVGTAFLVAQLNNTVFADHGLLIANILTAFARLDKDNYWGAAATAWENKVSNAVSYSQNPENTVSLQMAQMPSTPPTEAQSFALTTGADNIIGTPGDNLVNGYVNTTTPASSTLTGADTIDGLGGVNTLAFTVEGTAAGSMPAANILNVQKFLIRDVAGAPSAYDFSTVAGETMVVADRATNSVTFSKVGKGAVIGVKGNGVTVNGDVDFGMATNTDAVALAFTDGTNNAGGLVLAAPGSAATEATIASTGAANKIGGVRLAAAGTVKTLTVTADANLTIGTANGLTDMGGFAAAGGDIIVVGKAASVALNDLQDNVSTVDASAFAGGVTAVGSAASKLASFKGGAGADKLTAGKLTATGSVALGAGDDSFLAAATVVKSTNSVDGGTGTDTFGLAAVDAANVATFSNFEVANLDNLAAVTYDMTLLAGKNVLAGLTAGTAVSAAAAKVTNITSATANLTVVGDKASSGLDLGVKDAATSTADTFALKFNVAADPADTVLTPKLDVTINDVEAINVTSAGGAKNTNTLMLKTTAMAQATATNKVTQTIKVDGANQLTLDVTGDAVANTKVVVDGSAATGKLIVIGSSTTTSITGGAGDDNIKVGAVASSVTGGAGKDIYNVELALGNVNLTGLTGAAAGDTIDTVAAGGSGTLGAATSLGGDTNIPSILNTLALAAAASTAKAAWAAVGTDVYLVAGAGGIAADNAVKLTGVTDLSSWTMDAAGVIAVV